MMKMKRFDNRIVPMQWVDRIKGYRRVLHGSSLGTGFFYLSRMISLKLNSLSDKHA